MASRRRRSRDGPDERPKAERREQQGGRGSPGNPGGAPAHDARDRPGEQGGPSAQARVHRWSESNAANVPTASRRTTVGGQKKSPQSAGSSISAAKKSRRRPTLPHGFPCSTIGSEELNFRVRDGIGCGLLENTTGNLWIAVQARFTNRHGAHCTREAGFSQSESRMRISNVP